MLLIKIELENKTSQIETLSTKLNNLQRLQSKELVCTCCVYLFLINFINQLILQSQNIGGERNQSVSKSVMTDTHISENEQMRQAIPNNSNILTSLQMSYHHQNMSIHDPSILNLSLSPPLTKDSINMQNSINVRLTFFIYVNKIFFEINIFLLGGAEIGIS